MLEQIKNKEDYINSFDDLYSLGSVGFDLGSEVSFQPYGRYENERFIWKIRLWEGYTDLISITFIGNKMGVDYPDSERITWETFDQRKNTYKIRKVE